MKFHKYIIIISIILLALCTSGCYVTRALNLEIHRKTKEKKSFLTFTNAYRDDSSIFIAVDRIIMDKKIDTGLVFKFSKYPDKKPVSDTNRFKDYDKINDIYIKFHYYVLFSNNLLTIDSPETPNGFTIKNKGERKKIYDLELYPSKNANDLSVKKIPWVRANDEIFDSVIRKSVPLIQSIRAIMSQNLWVCYPTKSEMDSVLSMEEYKDGFITYFYDRPNDSDLNHLYLNYYRKDINGNIIGDVYFIPRATFILKTIVKPFYLQILYLFTVPIDIISSPVQIIIYMNNPD